MSYDDLNSVIDMVKRLLSRSVISGTYSDDELVEFVKEANVCVGIDWSYFGDYTITASGIDPDPTSVDKILMSFKSASLANLGLMQESVGDAIMIRAGKITLDTSKSLRARGIEADRLETEYTRLINRLQISGNANSGSSTLGYKLDNYIERASQANHTDPESL